MNKNKWNNHDDVTSHRDRGCSQSALVRKQSVNLTLLSACLFIFASLMHVTNLIHYHTLPSIVMSF